MLSAQPIESTRKTPSQARSKQTVSIIIEAAAQVFAELGEEKLTTRVVAERAGVSIGTIYQYFSNRDSILVALAEEERQRLARRMKAQIGSISSSGTEGSAREFVRALISSFARRGGAKRQVQRLAALKEKHGVRALQSEFADVLADAWARLSPAGKDASSNTRAYVLTYGIFGALQAAAIEDQKLLRTRELEDALCLMVAALRPSGLKKADAGRKPAGPR